MSTRSSGRPSRVAVVDRRAWPRTADEVRQLEDARSASCQVRIWARASAPVMKKKSASRPRLAQVAQRVDRVRRSAAVDVDPRHREARVGRGRDHRHQVAVLGGGDLAVGLLPRLTGRDEDDLVEVEPGLDLRRGDEVAVVDRVERAAHDPDPWRLRPRLILVASSGVRTSLAEDEHGSDTSTSRTMNTQPMPYTSGSTGRSRSALPRRPDDRRRHGAQASAWRRHPRGSRSDTPAIGARPAAA